MAAATQVKSMAKAEDTPRFLDLHPEVREKLTEGLVCEKIMLLRNPRKRHVWVSGDLRKVLWSKPPKTHNKPKGHILVHDLVDVVKCISLSEHYAFSIISTTRRLNLQVPTSQERELWLTYFRMLLSIARSEVQPRGSTKAPVSKTMHTALAAESSGTNNAECMLRPPKQSISKKMQKVLGVDASGFDKAVEDGRDLSKQANDQSIDTLGPLSTISFDTGASILTQDDVEHDVVMSGHSLYTNAGDLLFHFNRDLTDMRVAEEDEDGSLSVFSAPSSVSASSSRRGSIADVLESWRNSRRHSSAKMRKLSCSHTLADLSEEKSLELLALLVRGVTIKKHYRADKMKQLRLWTSLTFDQLLWGRETEDGTALTVKGGVGVCEISDIVSYGGGCTFSSSFSEHATPSCCFSVVTARETLDAEMPSEIQRREILLALRYLVWLSHSPPSATGIRESFYFWWSQTPSDRNGLLRYGSAQAQIPTSRSVQETVRPGRRLSAPRSRFSSRGKETSTKAPGGGLEHIGVASPAAAQASPLASAASVSASGSTKRVPKGALQKLRITVVPPSLHEEDFSNKFQEFLNFKRAELEREFEEWQRATK